MNARTEAESVQQRGGKTLILSRAQVRQLLRLDECIAAVEDGFRGQGGESAIPPGVLSAAVPGGAFHVKSAGLRLDRSYFAAKLNGNFHRNGARFGLPRIQGLIILCDAENGYPLAVMDSTEITVVRTGAATAVAAKYLARRDAATATVCGCGLQGRIQLEALAQVRPVTKAFAIDVDTAAAQEYARDMSTRLKIEVRAGMTLQRACLSSDLIVTCTPAKQPFLSLNQVRAGTFVAAVGADSEEKQELAPELLASAHVVVDHLEQCAQIGELHHAIQSGVMTPGDILCELAEVVKGERPGRQSAAETIVFDSTGVAHQDVAAASLVFRKAVLKRVGQWLDLLGTSSGVQA